MTNVNRDLRARALEVFLALEERPGDPSARDARDAFLARGEDAQKAYRQIQRIWGASAALKPARRQPQRAFMAMAVAASIACVLWLGLPFSSSDYTSAQMPEQVLLAGGHVLTLDAGSAVSQDREDRRDILTLDSGAAYFEIEKRIDPLDVVAGDLTIRVLGTEFAVDRSDDAVTLEVAEGRVEAVWPTGSTVLEGGAKLTLAGGSAVEASIPLDAIAAWRTDRLVAEDQAFASIAAILDRRIQGPVVIASQSLGRELLTGGFSLADPMEALRAAAAVTDAQVIALPPVMTIVTRN
ncbi:MAG: FecR domain-containing protein [Pseudomonadota bacterium]